MLVKDSKPYLKIGQWVKTNGNSKGVNEFFEGEIGEITEDLFFVWQNNKSGKMRNIFSNTRKCKYSWGIYFNNDNAVIEILKQPNERNITMKSIQNYFEKHQEPIITIGIVLIIDEFLFAGKLREKVKAILEKALDGAGKKIGGE